MTADELVGNCGGIELRLENGDTVVLHLVEETQIPGDPGEQEELLRRIPARFAFWLYQEKRALRLLRVEEHRCRRVEAEWYFKCRSDLQYKEGGQPTEKHIDAWMTLQEPVSVARRRVNAAKTTYDLTWAAREAVQSTLHVLRTRVQTNRASGPPQ
jgi:hypothetical protein